MKILILGLLTTFLISITFAQCISKTKNAEITLVNKSSYNLTDKLIKIPRSKIKYLPVNSNLYPLLISSKGDSIAVQLNDLDGDKTWDELVFTANLSAKKTLIFTLELLPLTRGIL